MSDERPGTVADVRRMLQGEPPLATEPATKMPLPPGAVSATVETVDAKPMVTTETVLEDVPIDSPAVPRRVRRS